MTTSDHPESEDEQMARKQRLRRKATGYNEFHRLQLRHRWDYLDGAWGDDESAFPAMEKAWRQIGDSVLQEHIADRPGTRPWAWWRFSLPAGERRERTDGKPHPFDDPAFDQPRELHYGEPLYLREHDRGARFETQREYLERRNLLLPCEVKELQRKDAGK